MSEKDWHVRCFYRVTIKAVIHDTQGKVLVVREKNNPAWNLPGGGMDYGENEYDALKRELHEEVGYEGEFQYSPLGIRPMYLEKQKVWQLWVVYEVEPAHYNFKVGEEADEIAFKDIAEFKDSRPHMYRFSMMKSDVKRKRVGMINP